MSRKNKTEINPVTKLFLAMGAMLVLLFLLVKIGQGIANKIMASWETSTDNEYLTASVPPATLPGVGTLPGSTAEKTTQSSAPQGSSLPTLPTVIPPTTTEPEPETTKETEPPTEPRETDTEYHGIEVAYTRPPSHYIYTMDDFGIERYVSPFDANGDGIDDQTQFLIGAREFLDHEPAYKSSSYFRNGFPEPDENGDWYGVCSDVINMGFLAAGYNLQTLIEQDIKAHPDWYPGEIAERQINFRRVRNQYYFFLHHADSLTLDPLDIDAWQPGDVVVFGDIAASSTHIVFVSERRAEDGVPYVLHLATPGQTLFEEDYLISTTKKIIGHFRYSGYNGEP